MESPFKKSQNEAVGTVIKFIVLVWSAGLLTASYAGILDKFDPTYVASILSGTLTTFHINREKKE
jgi:hypothetical protein